MHKGTSLFDSRRKQRSSKLLIRNAAFRRYVNELVESLENSARDAAKEATELAGDLSSAMDTASSSSSSSSTEEKNEHSEEISLGESKKTAEKTAREASKEAAFYKDLQFSDSSIDALREVAEKYLLTLFDDDRSLCNSHPKHPSIAAQDVKLKRIKVAKQSK